MKRKKTREHQKKSTKNPLIIKISLVIIVFFILFVTVFKITEFILTNKADNFPKIEISLSEVPIEEIDLKEKTIKYPGNTLTLVTNDSTIFYENVELKGRGNATWDKPKKPYQIKFQNKESPFGLNEEKKWLLLANYSDATSLRTSLAFYLEQLVGEKYPLHGDFTELYIDGNYRGLYYLTEKVEISKNRVNLTDEYSSLIELDNLYGEIEGCHYDLSNDCLVTKDTVNQDNESLNTQDFLHSFNSLRTAIANQDYEKVKNLADVDSFARYYLLNEFTSNPDAYSTSFFMHKDSKESKIFAGPSWDFDAAFGNKTWNVEGMDEKLIHSPSETMPFKNYLDNPVEVPHSKTISSIMYDLLDIPEFETRVKEIYQETLSGKGEELLEYIQKQADYIRPAALRDQERWKLKTNFDEEVDYLIDWVAKRYDHFEQTYGASSNLAPEFPLPSQE